MKDAVLRLTTEKGCGTKPRPFLFGTLEDPLTNRVDRITYPGYDTTPEDMKANILQA